MMAAVEVQKAIRARLVAAPYLVALVPATAIYDRHKVPVASPSIVIGEGTASGFGSALERALSRHVFDLHVWKQEPSFEGCKLICAAIHRALFAHRLEMAAPFVCVEASLEATRYLRDPSGDWSHGVVTVAAVVHGVADGVTL